MKIWSLEIWKKKLNFIDFESLIFTVSESLWGLCRSALVSSEKLVRLVVNGFGQFRKPCEACGELHAQYCAYRVFKCVAPPLLWLEKLRCRIMWLRHFGRRIIRDRFGGECCFDYLRNAMVRKSGIQWCEGGIPSKRWFSVAWEKSYVLTQGAVAHPFSRVFSGGSYLP